MKIVKSTQKTLKDGDSPTTGLAVPYRFKVDILEKTLEALAGHDESLIMKKIELAHELRLKGFQVHNLVYEDFISDRAGWLAKAVSTLCGCKLPPDKIKAADLGPLKYHELAQFAENAVSALPCATKHPRTTKHPRAMKHPRATKLN